MIPEATAAAVGFLGARALVHRAILRGLRAPRVPHALQAGDLPVAPGQVREVHIPGPRGRRLFAWLVMPAAVRGGNAALAVPAVLALHGWGGNAAMMGSVVPPLHAAGFAADRLALLGHSVGAAATLLHASRQDDVRAVISLSSFAHPREMMRRFMGEKRVPYPVLGWYVMRHVQRVIGTSFDAIAPLNTIAQVRCPVLLVHGRQDSTVPFKDACRLQAKSVQARLLPVAGDHDLRQALKPYTAELVEFLTQAFAAADALQPAPTRRAATLTA